MGGRASSIRRGGVVRSALQYAAFTWPSRVVASFSSRHALNSSRFSSSRPTIAR